MPAKIFIVGLAVSLPLFSMQHCAKKAEQVESPKDYCFNIIQFCVDSTINVDPGISARTYYLDFGDVPYFHTACKDSFLRIRNIKKPVLILYVKPILTGLSMVFFEYL